MTLYCLDKLTGETTLDCNAISFIQTLAGRQIFLCIRGWCSAVDFVFFYLFFWSCTGDRTDSWNYWDGTRLRQWNQCTFWAQIISHQLFSDMTLCIYSCRGALSTLFITFPDWNWSLRSRATGKEMDLIRCWGAASTLCCHLKPRRFVYLFFKRLSDVMLEGRR